VHSHEHLTGTRPRRRRFFQPKNFRPTKLMHSDRFHRLFYLRSLEQQIRGEFQPIGSEFFTNVSEVISSRAMSTTDAPFIFYLVNPGSCFPGFLILSVSAGKTKKALRIFQRSAFCVEKTMR
jgi:hypothetical protein